MPFLPVAQDVPIFLEPSVEEWMSLNISGCSPQQTPGRKKSLYRKLFSGRHVVEMPDRMTCSKHHCRVVGSVGGWQQYDEVIGKQAATIIEIREKRDS